MQKDTLILPKNIQKDIYLQDIKILEINTKHHEKNKKDIGGPKNLRNIEKKIIKRQRKIKNLRTLKRAHFRANIPEKKYILYLLSKTLLTELLVLEGTNSAI